MVSAKVGIVALQGAVDEHALALAGLGATPIEVREPHQLGALDALILPGGESTTMSILLESSGLFDAIAERLDQGFPTLGTCAGMILLATEIVDGRADQRHFGAVDITVRRNAFGRQVDSFETSLEVEGLPDQPFLGVFIRAPYVERAGPGVEVLARVEGRPVLCRQGAVTVTAFHPELSGDLRLHEMFLGGW